jgi:SAM-dependent methyltransferase
MRYLKGLLKKMRPALVAESRCIVTDGSPPKKLTTTQTLFLKWNAERLNISIEDSRQRFLASWASVRGGHAGKGFRRLTDLSHRLLQVFSNDSAHEVYDAYQLHAPTHFLRMLSYREPTWGDNDVVVQKLAGRSRVDILDYGCGLAQKSRELAKYLREKGVTVHLALADIPTLRKEFLQWLGKHTGIETTTLDCTAAHPVPNLPPCDICFATEVFEHIHEPVRHFEAIHSALKPNGLLVTDVSDHVSEFMHVSPHLAELQDRLKTLGYEELRPRVLYQKHP